MKDVWWGHGDGTVGVFGGHTSFGDARRSWDFRSLGRGDVNFEEIIVALNDVELRRPALASSGRTRAWTACTARTESAAFLQAARLRTRPRSPSTPRSTRTSNERARTAPLRHGRRRTQRLHRRGPPRRGCARPAGRAHRGRPLVGSHRAPASRPGISASPTTAPTARGRSCSTASARVPRTSASTSSSS